jgi:hypothetical protein
MKKTGLVLMLSAAAICDASAGEAVRRNVLFAQMDQPKQTDSSRANSSGGSCMPIGLTANGELVFPWECRELIERERGPVSLDLSAPPKDSAKNIAKDPAPNVPTAGELTAKPSLIVKPSSLESPTVDAASKDHAVPQGSDAEHVGSIPDAGATSPAPAAAILRPADRRGLGKRSVARRQPDGNGPPTPVTPATTRPNRQARSPSPG